MKVWILFLIGSFVLAGRAQLRGRHERLLLVFGVCLLVAVALSSQRLV